MSRTRLVRGTAFAAPLSIAERIACGQRLSQQGASLLVASVKAGYAPKRALRA